jgi:uracil-DNA glycosylase
VEPYPEGVAPVPGRLSGIGFFPGGAGLWNVERGTLPPLPANVTMILGHNLDSESNYRKSMARGCENLKGSTWRQLTGFLGRVFPEDGDVLGRCFFTNFFMGLIAQGSSVGRFPGARDRAFVERCRAFLLRQIEIVRPSVLIVLGGDVPRLLAPLAPELSPWAGATGVADLDRKDAGLLRDVELGGVSISAAALVHPSFRHANVWRRRFAGLAGEAAEVELVRRAHRLVEQGNGAGAGGAGDRGKCD